LPIRDSSVAVLLPPQGIETCGQPLAV